MKNINQLKNNGVLPASTIRAENHSAQFHAALAHELRNPLANIILSVHELESLMGSNAEMQTYLDIIMRGTERINNLASMLLKSNASEAMQHEAYSIHRLLDEVLEISDDRIRLKHILVSRNYEPEDCRVLINAEEMRMALTNIIVNALDAMAKDIGNLKINTRSIANKLIVQIEDNGCGIPEDDLKKIFKSHFTNKPGGLGVGLASTSDILQSNHIAVDVKSEEGRGTCFSLLLDKV